MVFIQYMVFIQNPKPAHYINYGQFISGIACTCWSDHKGYASSSVWSYYSGGGGCRDWEKELGEVNIQQELEPNFRNFMGCWAGSGEMLDNRWH